MKHNAKSLRPFIGAKDFDTCRAFYRDLGFEEHTLGPDMSVFLSNGNPTFAFYLQRYYNEDWVNNTMVFMEVDNVERFWTELKTLDLPDKYPGARTVPIRTQDWGRECFVHDPSGVLWHFGEFFDV
jgi:catechol 2,3-dioxygenase-like lactoylglutathione lyase family enzyme